MLMMMRRSNELGTTVQHSTHWESDICNTLNWYYFWWSFTPWTKKEQFKFHEMPTHCCCTEKNHVFFIKESCNTLRSEQIFSVLFTQFENVPFCCDNNCKVYGIDFVVFLEIKMDKTSALQCPVLLSETQKNTHRNILTSVNIAYKMSK